VEPPAHPGIAEKQAPGGALIRRPLKAVELEGVRDVRRLSVVGRLCAAHDANATNSPGFEAKVDAVAGRAGGSVEGIGLGCKEPYGLRIGAGADAAQRVGPEKG
jgi:hypothetical protein